MIKKILHQPLPPVLILALLLVTCYCGKRGPLTLQPDFEPQVVQNFQVLQEGTYIKLIWEFPQSGNLGKKQKPFDSSAINSLYVYYSDKPIDDKKFLKKASLLLKLSPTELGLVAINPLQKAQAMASTPSTSKNTPIIPWQNLTYSTKIPFKLNQLDNKIHYFAILYKYEKKKSPLSPVISIPTTIPVQAINDLKAIRENKLIKLSWSRPLTNEAGLPTTHISGYNVYRKIDRTIEKKDLPDPASTPPPLPSFLKINTTNIINEYFEDQDTGTNGTFSYHVSVVMAANITSAPSNPVSVEVTDIYPPDIPANLVVFKAKGHMLLTWKPVQDKDLSHYRIYRLANDEDEFSLLDDHITESRYKDRKIKPGHSYTYAVTAIDKKGNESAYSNKVSEKY